MEKKKAYSGIDIFRLIAAILVIANHTSPLSDLSDMGDYVLSSIIARLAVPFFFMTSGFFLIRKMQKDNEKLVTFIKRSSLIYLVAIIVNLPLNLYNSYFSAKPLLPMLLQDLVFNGTIYHLWYLPASIIGTVIVWFLVRKLGFKRSIIASTALYVIGLMGSGYYGLSAKVPFIKNIYDEMFVLTSSTKNGIFFAPIFILTGGLMYKYREKVLRPSITVLLFGASLILMSLEGLLLQKLKWQREECMFIFLLPAVYFLFSFLMTCKGKRYRTLRDVSLTVYVTHMVVITAVRFGSKIVGLEKLFVENNLVHFTAVTVGSLIIAFVFAIIKDKLTVKKPGTEKQRSWIELDRKALEHDVAELSKLMPDGCKIMAVAKAEAYGHGAFETAALLDEMGVNAYCVATIDEGIALRKYGVDGIILILGYTDITRARDLKKYKLTQTVFDTEYASALNSAKHKISVHIAVDSGMHRLGISHDRVEDAEFIYGLKNLKVDGIFSHLCVSDSDTEEDIAFTRLQIKRFDDLITKLKTKGIKIKTTHIQGSYGLINYSELEHDYARVGISLFGVDSESASYKNKGIDLSPALSVRSKIVQLRTLPSGESVGYGRTYYTDKETKIAVVPIGYADGIPRYLSGKAQVIVSGKRCPVIGRICMDQLMIDVTSIEDADVGTIVTLIGKDGDEFISVEEIAEKAETITNEILCRLGKRLNVIVK